MLPVIASKKPVSLQPPTKGRRGIFSLYQDSGEHDAYQGVVPLPPMATSRQAPPAGPASLLPPVVDVAPRGAPPQADVPQGLEETAKPMTARTQARRERKAQQEQDFLEARRALRTRAPGDWDAKLFRELRKRFSDEGKWGVVSGLTGLVAQTTVAALEARRYLPAPNAQEVRLPAQVQDSWVGIMSLQNVPLVEAAWQPPLICTALGPLEAMAVLKEAFHDHPFVLTFEATDFSREGELLGTVDSRSAAQQDLFLRTNLEHHMRQASITCKGVHASVQDHLTATIDPYIIVASSVRAFRGPADQGYPFLGREDVGEFTVLVSGRHAMRPEISRRGRGEYFVQEQDVLACMDRLHLFALAGATVHGSALRPQSEEPHVESNRLPVMVISANDLTVAGSQQPRNSIAAAFKSWRKLYAHMFEGIVIACGDKQTADILDKTINGDIHCQVINSTWNPGHWHWNVSMMDMASNPTFSQLGYATKTARMQLGEAVGGWSDPKPHKSQGGVQKRRSSVAQSLTLLSEVLTDQDRSPGVRSTLSWSLSQSSSQASMHSMPGGGGRKLSFISEKVGMDSRSAHERAVTNRLNDMAVSDPAGPEAKRKASIKMHLAQQEATAGFIRASAVSAFTKLGKGMRSIHQKPSSKKETLKKVDQAVAFLGQQLEMKDRYIQVAERGIPAEELVVEKNEADRLMDDIQSLVAVISLHQAPPDPMLSPRKRAVPKGALEQDGVADLDVVEQPLETGAVGVATQWNGAATKRKTMGKTTQDLPVNMKIGRPTVYAR